MQLSILICTIPGRPAKVFEELTRQAAEYKDYVEVLMLGDNKAMTTGAKRNLLVSIARGKYVAFVDDDDIVHPMYVREIMKVIMEGNQPDAINFPVEYYLDGHHKMNAYYSVMYGSDMNLSSMFLRLPNHIMVVKRELAADTKYSDVTLGEDAEYAVRLAPHIRSEARITQPLYRYMDGCKTKRITVIALSKADTPMKKQVTEYFISSLIKSKVSVDFDIVIVEGADVEYEKAGTIHLQHPFNYNRYMNEAYNVAPKNPITVFSNNDMEFTPGWADVLVSAMERYQLDSASPTCRIRYPYRLFPSPAILGVDTGKLVLGHCIAVKSAFFEAVGKFNTDVTFWCSDNAWSMQVANAGGRHALVANSVANHLGGVVEGLTLRNEPADRKEELTHKQVDIFNKKFNQNIFNKEEDFK